LIHRPPQIVTLTVNREKAFIQMPLVARSGAPAPQLMGVCLAKLPAPLAERLLEH
jgi:hypothetical protein